MAAQIPHAVLAAKRSEGRCASGPSIRSANTVSMIACRRCVMSACAVGSVLLVKRVVAPDREQLVGAGAVAHPAHHQPGGDRMFRGGECGERHLGDLGVEDQLAGVGIHDCARVAHRRPRVVGDAADGPIHRVVAHQRDGEPHPALTQAPTTALLP
jgi:hypothetical protein